MTMIAFPVLHRRWMKNLDYKAECHALREEFALIGALIEARQPPPECMTAAVRARYPKS